MTFNKIIPAAKISSLMKDIEWKSFLGRNPRRLVLPVTGILIVIIAVLFGFLPVLNNIKAKKKSIEINEVRLKELASLSKRYKEIKEFNSEIDRKISSKGTRFELLSFLEEVAKRTDISGKISSMQPSEGDPREFTVSIVLKDISMEELVDYLYEIIYSDKVVSVRKMHLKVQERGTRTLEASLVISTLKSPHGPSSP